MTQADIIIIRTNLEYVMSTRVYWTVTVGMSASAFNASIAYNLDLLARWLYTGSIAHKSFWVDDCSSY